MWGPPKEISRKELYRQVWAEPMVKVAKSYGLSDRGLAKICQRNDIPRPPRGYWAKKAVGIDVERSRLPRPNSNDIILIQASGYQAAPKSDHYPRSDDVLFQIQKIHVPGTLSDPHPLVQKTLIESESCQPNRHGIIELNKKGLLDIRVSRECLNRALRIMDAVVKTLERLECEVKIIEEETIVCNSDVDVRFGIVEKTKRRRLEARDHDLENSYYRFGYNLYEENLSPTGFLGLKIHDYLYSRMVITRRNWQETSEVPIEEKLSSFIRGLLKVAAFNRKDGKGEMDND